MGASSMQADSSPPKAFKMADPFGNINHDTYAKCFEVLAERLPDRREEVLAKKREFLVRTRVCMCVPCACTIICTHTHSIR